MTVVYTHEVATGSKAFGNFRKLLFRWTGSIYKLVLPDLCIYIILYYAINLTYRFVLAERDENDLSRRFFHRLVEYCKEVSQYIPLQFVLGFYVSQIVTRWWSEYMTTPWPDTLAVTVASTVRGHDERGRLMRRTILRYVNTSLVMVFSMISPQARTRFPTLEHLVEGGFLVPHEKLIIEHLNEKSEGPKYFVPLVWAAAVVAKARKEGRIRDDIAQYHVIKEICKFRGLATDLLSYDWVCIPLVYTQVATLCTYVFFLASLLGKQLIKEPNKLDLYVPVFNFLEFFFLMGWLKVAETMINPFGEDDDDFEVNWLVDRNLTISYMIVDEMNTEFPEMLKDSYWETGIPDEIPYTAEALKFKTEGMGQGSAALQDKDYKESDTKSNKGEPSMTSSHNKSVKRGFSLPFHVKHHEQHHKQHHHKDKSAGNVSVDVANLMDRTYVPKGKDSQVFSEEPKK